MTDQDASSAREPAKREARSQESAEENYADKLTMPQEDDPAGDGHMWSGTDAPAEDAAETDEAFDAPTHIPTHPTGPSPF